MSKFPQTDTSGFHNGQLAWQLGKQRFLLQETIYQPIDICGSGIARKIENDDACILIGRILANVGKTIIAGDQAEPLRLGIAGDLRVLGDAGANVAHIHSLVSMSAHNVAGRTWQVGVNEEAHGYAAGTGNG